ncbi:hypothetical protein DFH07DRAFT_1067029 [Mycena maculata]|uniref:DUF7918 domain-containing protein n=1 Tax=Mycena maculata TaxID=230809 RepID=A0AAD7HPB1_9AGAR|nr:hypothetical protein DFH07DRAFT_1067029 [Mycena maculata]
MLTHRGFSAWIVVEGKPVPEYLVAEDNKASRVSCWIPSEEGQKFKIYWKDHGGKVDSCAFITLDGVVVPGRFLFGSGETFRQGVRSSVNTERPFVFQKVEEDEPSSHSVNKDVGMITLRIKRIQRVASRPANPVQELPSVLGKRKAGDLCIGFGEDTRAYDQYAYTWSVKPYEKDSPAGARTPGTFVSFVFRYRSREFLQMQGIMPEGEDVAPSPPTTRASMRRVSSAPAIPATAKPTLITPSASPSPPRKKHKPGIQEKPYLPSGPRRPRRPSADLRRTVSYQVTSREFSDEPLLKFEPLEEEDVRADDPEWTG